MNLKSFLFFFPTVIIFSSLQVFGFIPKPSIILQRLAENSGNGVYQIEQEVQLSGSSIEPIVLKEVWTIENDGKMKLVVTGIKEPKNQIHLEYIYDSNTRVSINSNNKRSQQPIGESFIEKYFHIRKLDTYYSILLKMNVLTPELISRKPYRKGADPDVIDDPRLRLVRVGGTISYAFGLPSDVGEDSNLNGQDSSAAFFIEQDIFVLRKIRFKSRAEITAEQYASYPRGLNFPKLRTLKWQSSLGSVQAVIHTLKVTSKPEKSATLTLEDSHDLPTDLGASKNLVEEFYSRFR